MITAVIVQKQSRKWQWILMNAVPNEKYKLVILHADKRLFPNGNLFSQLGLFRCRCG